MPTSSKPTARQAGLLPALADHIRTHGIASASLRPLARSAGTSDRMLIYHFGSKTGVIEAALAWIARKNRERLAGLLPSNSVSTDTIIASLEPELESRDHRLDASVLFELAALALREDAAAKAIGHDILSGYLDWLTGLTGSREDARQVLRRIEGDTVLAAFGL
ncbi:MAG: TetR/AcrR family transcriptional regulator [Litorimonas sp.]